MQMRLSIGLMALILACGGEPSEAPSTADGAGEAGSEGPPAQVDPSDDIGGTPPPMPVSGVAPLTMSVPKGLFTEVEVQCAGGFVERGSPEDAGANAIIMVHGLPEGESCAIFMKGSITSRYAPVTGGQRWSCKFRMAEPMCKLLGGPEGPTIATPEDWPWDKVDNKQVSLQEAKVFDDAQESEKAKAP